MILLDLFSGIGGFSLAAHWMGWKTAAFVEKDEFCQKILKKNFKGVPIYGDITEFSGEPFRGRCDIVTGGFPCQPFSQAGKREGTSDERYLFPQMLRVISEVKPKFVVAENVRGLLSIESGQVFADVISSLEGEGYEVVTFCVPASAVGAPHRRDRLWIIAQNADGGNGGSSRRNSLHERRTAGENRAKGLSKNTERENDFTVCDAQSAVAYASDSESERPGKARQFRRDESEKRITGGDQIITDSAIKGLENSGLTGIGQLFSESCQRLHDRFELENCDASNSERGGRQNIVYGRKPKRQTRKHGNGHTQFNGWQGSWLEAATALCRMDDGIPRQLDRTNRLKALGNSIVPQIAYEIFKAIEAAEFEVRNK